MKKRAKAKMKLFLILLITIIGRSAYPQVWQWSNLVRNAKEGGGSSRAYLWIPENCKKVRGVIVAQNNMEELSILENKSFRQEMTDLGLAEIWVAPSFSHVFNFKEGAGETFNGIMNDLADSSGYEELKFAPVVAIGHSAAASWPYYFAVWNPQRTLACVSVSGQWPYFRNPQFAPDIWSKDQHIDFVPSLETMGEYEAADTWSAEGLKERQAHPYMPLSMLAAPAEGHFAATQKKIDYIARYIKKAVLYRLKQDVTTTSPATLNPIDPTKSGWLVDKWRKDQLPTAPAAPVEKFTGNAAEAFWFFDEEMARATEKYEAAYRHMKPQLLGYIQEGKMVNQKNTHLQVDLKFLPKADGITFSLTGKFMDTVSGGSSRLKDWAELPVGSVIGHSSNNTSISIDPVIGPVKKIAHDVFELALQKGYEGRSQLVITFAATHPGDKIYKPAVQQSQMIIPRNTTGFDQHIDFAFIPNQPIVKYGLSLNATSDAGMPVYFFVKEGPATVKGHTLKFSKIPLRANYPVKVTIVAWQWGRGTEPKVKTAEPVERSFFITR